MAVANTEGSAALLLLPVWLVGVIVVLALWSRGYVRPEATKGWQDVSLARDGYCLVLRPFGQDGRVIVPAAARIAAGSPLRANTTLEELIASTVTSQLGMRTVALVDADQLFAPPGPLWVRAPRDWDAWKTPVDRFIGEAYAIFLIIPPEEEIRDSVRWEIRRVFLRGRRTRTTIMLPPPDQDVGAYLFAFHQMCVVLAALERYGKVEEHLGPDDLDVRRHRRELSKDTVAAKLTRPAPLAAPTRESWPRVEDGWRSVAVADTYREALTAALAGIRAEFPHG